MAAGADLPALRRVLLEILSPQGPAADTIAKIGDEAWEPFAAMAAQHRLEPLLHQRLEDWNVVPRKWRTEWAEAHRAQAIAALVQRATLFDVVRKLLSQGIETVALKGAWLAWYAWPEAALRPMRDIDVLVAEPDQAQTAWDLLRGDGWSLGKPFEGDEDGKELPELVSRDGVALELHRRCWETSHEAKRSMPQQGVNFSARAVSEGGDDPARYPARDDMFAHLVIHAAYSHWLDAGPLLLGDISYVLEGWDADWPAIWERAEREGWARGAALVLALTDRWWSPGLLARTGCGVTVPDAVLERAPDLLLQDLDHRRASLLAAEWEERGGLTGRIGKYWKQPGALLGKLTERSIELANSDTRAQAQHKIALRDWLETD